MPSWRLADRTLDLEAPGTVVGAGIVNVTVDSMHPGARSGTPEQAVADGLALAAQGFEMIDVGAVAARSGPPVAAAEEIERLDRPPSRAWSSDGVPVSADTFEPEVATAAAAAGAVVVNDIGGGDRPDARGRRRGRVRVRADAHRGAAAGRPPGARLRGRRRPPQAVLRRSGSPAPSSSGVAEEAIAIDPGLDFDLTVADDVEILRRLEELHALGRPIYMSLSRKDFVGALLAGSWEGRLPAERRGPGTFAAAAIAAAKGAQIHRLHDAEALDAVRMAARIAAAGPAA